MKILYAIQGTGNGHVSRARAIIPHLQQYGEVDLLLSGCQADIALPYPIRFRLNGLSFVFGKKGGIDYVETYKRSRIKQLYQEIKDLPVLEYDLVISDFEPVSAWACRLRGKPCAGLSHQLAVLHKQAPLPRKADLVGRAVLKYYAPVDLRFGFHFLPYGKQIYTPVIRQEIRDLQSTNEGHYTVYLPAYDDKRTIRFLSLFPQVRWEVFSKHCKEPFQQNGISIKPVDNDGFVYSMSRAAGVLCGAGFETPAEVMFLQKKLMVVPMKGQYEQHCNAAALAAMGVPVLKSLKSKHLRMVQQWLEGQALISVDYPDETADVVRLVVDRYPYGAPSSKSGEGLEKKPAAFREFLLKKIFYRSTGV